jgi:hypothetical protein
VDNYVDGVDRPVNMQKNAGNIYAHIHLPKWRNNARRLHGANGGNAKTPAKTSRPLITDGFLPVTMRL